MWLDKVKNTTLHHRQKAYIEKRVPHKPEIYREVSSKKGKGVTIKRNLCFYNPKQVLEALNNNREVRHWLKYIENHYNPPTKDILLIYPCSTEKPYHEARSYKQLYKTLSCLGDDRQRIHLVTISEPFGLVPEEFYEKKRTWYDCPGLFEWWCSKYNQPYSKEDFNSCIDILATHIGRFFVKAKRRHSYKRILAFVRTWSSSLEQKNDHTHNRILRKAGAVADVDIEFSPPKRVIKNIVKKNGRLAWDMLGVAHPTSQQYLLRRLRRVLRETAN